MTTSTITHQIGNRVNAPRPIGEVSGIIGRITAYDCDGRYEVEISDGDNRDRAWFAAGELEPVTTGHQFCPKCGMPTHLGYQDASYRMCLTEDCNWTDV